MIYNSARPDGLDFSPGKSFEKKGRDWPRLDKKKKKNAWGSTSHSTTGSVSGIWPSSLHHPLPLSPPTLFFSPSVSRQMCDWYPTCRF